MVKGVVIIKEAAFSKVLFCLFIFVSCLSYTYNVQQDSLLAFVVLLAKLFLAIGYIISSAFLVNCLVIWALWGLFLSSVCIFFQSSALMSYALFFFMSYAIAIRSERDVADNFILAAKLVLLTVSSVMVLALLGFLETKIFFNGLGFAQQERNALGFYNPNPASLLLLSTVFVFFVYERIVWFWVAIGLFAFFSMWLYSRTYISLACLFPFFYLLRRLRACVLLNAVSVVLVVLTPLVAFFFVNYKSVYFFGVDLNAFLSNRLYMISQSFSAAGGINFFPSRDFLTIDPGLINLLGNSGLLIYLLFSFFVVLALIYNSVGAFSVVSFSFLLINLSENIFSPYNLLSLLFLVGLINKFSGGDYVQEHNNA